MPTTITVKEQLAAMVAAAGKAHGDWLRMARAKQRNVPADALTDEVSLNWAIARRQLGSERLSVTGEIDGTVIGEVDAGRWSIGDAGRVVLLMDALSREGNDALTLVQAVYRAGDETERAALVRALALFDEPRAYKHIALEAGRVNSLVLFSALAEFNPYPAMVYTDPEFNQLVLKCIFTGLRIANIVALESRVNADLARMCEDFHDERQAAGRQVPADIWLAMAPRGSQRALTLVQERLADDDPAHRFFASMALGWCGADGVQAASALRAALAKESNDRIRACMHAGLRSIDPS